MRQGRQTQELYASRNKGGADLEIKPKYATHSSTNELADDFGTMIGAKNK